MLSRVTRILSAPADPKAPREIPTLDGARGVAAMMVLVSHSANHGLLPPAFGRGVGQMGVILFFTLSGFLMAYLYIDRLEVVRYAAARIGRVMPLYFAVLLAVWAAWVFARAGIPGIGSGKALRDSLLLIKGSGVLWTIPVEIHFYVVFAGLWAVWQKATPRVPALLLAVALVAALAIVIGILLRRTDPQFYQALSFWMVPFAVGLLVGILYRRYWASFALSLDRFWRDWWTLPILGLFVLAMLRIQIGFRMPPFLFWGDPFFMGAPVFLFFAALGGRGVFSWLASPPARWLGSISYAVYLFHAPVISWVTAWLQPDDGFDRAVAFGAIIVITLSAASLSLVAFEAPPLCPGAWRTVRRSGSSHGLTSSVGRVPAARLWLVIQSSRRRQAHEMENRCLVAVQDRGVSECAPIFS